MYQDSDTELEAHGVKPTAVRSLIWQETRLQTETFSLADMERWLPTVDRSSIFRALRLFAEHHLLHVIDDGTGVQKYCVCRHPGTQHISHIHFNCIVCGKTYCLEDYKIPLVTMPHGFTMHDAEYIAKGICPSCGSHHAG